MVPQFRSGEQHICGKINQYRVWLQRMVGRGQRAMRLYRTSSKQEQQSSPGKEPHIAGNSKSSPAHHHVWPLAAKRRCFALLRKAHLANASHASEFHVTISTPSMADTSAVWPLIARRRMRRLWRASLSGEQRSNKHSSSQVPEQGEHEFLDFFWSANQHAPCLLLAIKLAVTFFHLNMSQRSQCHAAMSHCLMLADTAAGSP